jgi:hypothetical protein
VPSRRLTIELRNDPSRAARPGRSFRESALDCGFDADERLRRVDVDQRGLALERDFDHRLAVADDEVARAHIAFDRHQLGKEPPRPQHRIAPPALDGRHHDERAAVGIEGGDEAVDQARINLRHVAQADDRAVGVRRHGGDASAQRRAQPLGKVRIVNELDR